MTQAPPLLPTQSSISAHLEPEEEELDNTGFDLYISDTRYFADAPAATTTIPTAAAHEPQQYTLPQPPDVVQQTTIQRFQAAGAMIQVL